MIINKDNSPERVFDKHYPITCPHCQRETNATAISIPRYEYLMRFCPERIGLAYKCDACLEPIFIVFDVQRYDSTNHHVVYDDNHPTFVVRALELFDYEYLPETIQADFREATLCYSVGAYDAFAAMCRRTVQTMATNFGAAGKDRVQRQLKELQEMGVVDEDSFAIVSQVVVDGHDGAHPYLPPVSPERASILMQLMKDVLYQVYVRKAKIEEAAKLRQGQIAKGKSI